MGALDCLSSDRMKSTDSTEVFTINMTSSTSCLEEPRRDLESQFSKSNSNDKHSVWWTLGIDIPLLLIVAVIIILAEYNIIPSHQSGFYCNDPKLSFPFTGDTVSMVAIVLSLLLLPVLILYITEFIFLDAEYLEHSRMYQALRNTLWMYRSYAYGLLFNMCLIEVMKVITGMPRPTFFDICQPDTAKTCRGSEFVSSFTCTPSERFSAWFQSDSYHSFPSGHTSLSIHCALFLVWYLQRRAFHWSHRSVLLVPVVQLSLLAYAALSSLTRITDHRHHWWDVLTGSAIGILTMLYSVLVLSNNFNQFTSKADDVTKGPPTSSLLYPRPRELIS